MLLGKLRVHDLSGLCDATIARVLHRDRAALHEYVFGEVRPGLVRVQGHCAATAALHEDPRFERDYAAVVEWEHEDGVPAGIFVRRDLLRNPSELERLRRSGR